jgi:RNA polymerase sigma factor (sigma-70 family)
MSNDATVHVIDDDEAVRESLAFLLDSVGIASTTYPSAETFLEALDPAACACVVTDVRMPGMSGVDLLRRLGEMHCEAPVVVITGHADVAMAVEAMKLGAVDFIEKPFDDEGLLHSIRNALQHEEKQHALRARRTDISARVAELTPREHEVMTMVTDGKSNKEIAAALGVSAKTVEVHRARVMDKMRADSLAELVRMVLLTRGEPI